MQAALAAASEESWPGAAPALCICCRLLTRSLGWTHPVPTVTQGAPNGLDLCLAAGLPGIPTGIFLRPALAHAQGLVCEAPWGSQPCPRPRAPPTAACLWNEVPPRCGTPCILLRHYPAARKRFFTGGENPTDKTDKSPHVTGNLPGRGMVRGGNGRAYRLVDTPSRILYGGPRDGVGVHEDPFSRQTGQVTSRRSGTTS